MCMQSHVNNFYYKIFSILNARNFYNYMHVTNNQLISETLNSITSNNQRQLSRSSVNFGYQCASQLTLAPILPNFRR